MVRLFERGTQVSKMSFIVGAVSCDLRNCRNKGGTDLKSPSDIAHLVNSKVGTKSKEDTYRAKGPSQQSVSRIHRLVVWLLNRTTRLASKRTVRSLNLDHEVGCMLLSRTKCRPHLPRHDEGASDSSWRVLRSKNRHARAL